MRIRLFTLAIAVLASVVVTAAQEKPALVVRTFTVASGVNWPYDMKQMQLQTITELKIKDEAYFEVLADTAGSQSHVYTLDGEVTEWHAGNKATRMMIGMGTGRETAKIHYWLTDKGGRKVFEHTDTIRQAFWGNAYANSVGQLAQPFADKIADRLKDAKLVQPGAAPPAGKSETAAPAAAPPPAQSEPEAAKPSAETGIIMVHSTPEMAEVYVDGKFVGNAPATLKLPAGTHTIRVELKGYKEWSRELTVLGASEVKLAATLEKQD